MPQNFGYTVSLAKKNNITAAEWNQVRELLATLEGTPKSIRIKFYVDHRVPKPVRDEAEALLSVEDAAGTFMEEPLIKPAPSSLEFLPGDAVDGFKIVSEVGRGSFAVVYQAEELALGRRVALKVSRGSPAEAKLLASLEHDHIVHVFSERFEPDRGLRLVCMQLVPGATWEQILGSLEETAADRLTGEAILQSAEHISAIASVFHSSSLRERERIVRSDFVGAFLQMGALVADALSYAHSRGVLHLDVKPSNIMVTPFGRPMLADFNISIDEEDLAKAVPENFGGTFQYMPPEQKKIFDEPENPAVRKAVTAQADIYSLGIVLKEILAFAQVRKLSNSSSPEIGWVIQKATALNPRDRFATAADFAQALRTCLNIISAQRALPPLNRVTAFADRHPVIALTAIGAVPQLTASLVGILYNKVRIISSLSSEQMRIFDVLNSTYNPVIYTLVGVVWVSAVLHSVRKMDRACLRRLPGFGFLLTSLSWLPSAAIFVIVLNRTGSGLSSSSVGHLILSFALSWMIAASYSYLFHTWIVLRNLYARSWVGESEVAVKAESELAGVGSWAKACLRWVILIPLFGAVLLLGFGNRQLSKEEFDSFRYLGILFVTLSACGVFVAASLGAELQKILLAFENLKRP